jgi:Flp pilus assembly protein protease CpaA
MEVAVSDVWAMTLWHSPQPWVQWTAAAVGCAVAAGTDIKERRIPNWLTGPLFLAGLAFSAYTGGWRGAADGFCASILLALPFILLFLFAGGGAGDAKLMGAVGAWLGLINGAAALVAVSVAGILLAFAAAIAKGRAREVAGNVTGIMVGWLALAASRQTPGVVAPQEERPKAQTVPYGVAICAGVLFAGIGVLLWR